MKIHEILTESKHDDDFDHDDEMVSEPDQDTVKPLMVQLRSVYNLVKKYRDFQDDPDVKNILKNHPITFKKGDTAVIPVQMMADMLAIYPMLIPHMREKIQAQAWESPQAFRDTVSQLKAAIAKQRR